MIMINRASLESRFKIPTNNGLNSQPFHPMHIYYISVSIVKESWKVKITQTDEMIFGVQDMPEGQHLLAR